jgi:hypothetical protein
MIGDSYEGARILRVLRGKKLIPDKVYLM